VLVIASFYILDNIYYRDSVEFLRPIDAETLRIRNDSYGEGHFGAKRKNGRRHTGLDILAPVGTPVRASKSGWAVRKLDEDGYGNYVIVYHKGDFATLYAHLKETKIKWAKKVRQGDVVGWVGRSGNARYRGIKPHLHFEVRKGGSFLDPEELL